MRNKVSTTYTILYTILLCLAGAALLGSGLAISFGARNRLLFVVCIIGVVGVPVFLYLLMRAMNQRRILVSAEIRQNKAAIITQWELTGEMWSSYMTYARRELTKKQRTAPVGVMLAILAVASWLLHESNSWVISIMYGVAIALPIGGVVWLCYGMINKAQIQLLNESVGRIIFTQNHILINDQLIELTGFKRFVSKSEIDTTTSPITMHLTVSSKLGERESNHDYRIPVPADELVRAQLLVNRYYEDAAELREKMERMSNLADLAD
ncbi:hypothetical protein N6H18_04990 [Reichenbachiella agarivorans]|uniref:PH domain-containing protein n=1 Tax=Reichenbachiella agarivorans TaxID=2979464 RepID=A0ABY6CS04_9BACT|nr:hypothetical protein [Reichenbachiella agarivorans]UXP33305.1 hypothetical protein N6H18_04990 [Reichenbachiella agarivorans]